MFLVAETNFFRQELHKWCQVTTEPPPMFQESKSTRKPRPTKLQKLMAQYGVDDPDDLPEEVKGKANSLRRKSKYYQGRQEGLQVSPPASAQTPILGTPIRSEGQGFPHVKSENTTPQDFNPFARPGEAAPGEPLNVNARLMMPGGPRLAMDERSDSLEERLLRGELEGLNLHSEPVKGKALELLRRTDIGRRRAEEIYGPAVWSGGVASAGGGGGHEGGYPRDVEKMFVDLTNQDEEKKGDVKVMAEELESERNGVDALIDGE